MSRTFLFIILLIFLSVGCKSENVQGVIIGDTLLIHQSYLENQELKELIIKSLNKNEEAILKLKDVPNGGAAGSYELGYIITQIIYKIGEDDFYKIISSLSPEEIKGFEGYIQVGLEYGDNNHNGVMDYKKMNQEFPKLYSLFQNIEIKNL